MNSSDHDAPGAPSACKARLNADTVSGPDHFHSFLYGFLYRHAVAAPSPRIPQFAGSFLPIFLALPLYVSLTE